jgi:hypothetical protein
MIDERVLFKCLALNHNHIFTIIFLNYYDVVVFFVIFLNYYDVVVFFVIFWNYYDVVVIFC